MADRYWVGGTGTWDAAGTTHWSTISGGSSGASVPTSTDSVFFDVNANASAYTVTVTGPSWQATCLDLTTSAPGSGNLTLVLNDRGIINAYGNVSFYSGMVASYSAADNHLTLRATSASTFTTNGVNLPWIIQMWIGVSLTLLDDLNCVGGDGSLIFSKGTFYANNKNITTSLVEFNQFYDKTIYFGTGTWNIVSGNWTYTQTSAYTINFVLPNPASASTIKFSGNDSAGLVFHQGASPGTRDCGTVEIATTAAGGTVTFVGNFTFDTLKITGVARTLVFGDVYGNYYTTTLKNFQCSGSVGNLNIFKPVIPNYPNPTQQFTFVNSGGIVSNDYLDLSYCDVTPTVPQTWYAGVHSTDSGNNTGWSFTDPAIQKAVSGTLSFNGTLVTNHKSIIGLTKNYIGAALGSCLVRLIGESPLQQVAETTSDANGNYEARTAYGSPVRVLVTKAGTPNVQGVSDLITPQ